MPDSSDPRADLVARFDDAMLDVYVRAKTEVHYNATRFLEMVSAEGGLATAQRLLASPTVSDGFAALWEAGRQDLTVEAVVLQPDFQVLFTHDELRVAAERLGVSPPATPPAPAFAVPPKLPVPPREPNEAGAEPGDSREQREAELVLLRQLSLDLDVVLSPYRFGTADGLRVEVDGFSENPPILVEAWAHVGPAKSAQKHKVMTDALKLSWVDKRYLASAARKILLFGDSAAAAHFRSSSWMTTALADLGIELIVEEMPPDTRATVLSAQQRQFR